MGTEVLIGLALAAASTATTVYAQNQAAKRQDNELSSQLAAQRTKQKAADEKTKALIASQGQLNDAGDKATSLGKFTQAIQQAQGNVTRPLGAQGAVSDAYTKAGSDAVLGINKYGGDMAENIASIDAPTQARQRNIRTLDDYQNDINQIGRFSAGDDYLSNMRLRGIHANPWLMGAGQALGGASRSYGGGGFGSPTSGYTGGYDAGGGYTLY